MSITEYTDENRYKDYEQINGATANLIMNEVNILLEVNKDLLEALNIAVGNLEIMKKAIQKAEGRVG